MHSSFCTVDNFTALNSYLQKLKFTDYNEHNISCFSKESCCCGGKRALGVDHRLNFLKINFSHISRKTKESLAQPTLILKEL
jgi:hypothetical protein